MRDDQRSPWTGLSPRQSLTLTDALSEGIPAGEERLAAAWRVHETFARRAAMALVGNDLRSALDAAEVSAAALSLWRRYGAPDVVGQSETIVHQYPAPTLGAEPAPWPGPAHGPHRLSGVPAPG